MTLLQVELNVKRDYVVVHAEGVRVEFSGPNVTVTVTDREHGNRFRCLGNLTTGGWVVNSYPFLEVSQTSEHD